jgi:hypothetical protein
MLAAVGLVCTLAVSTAFDVVFFSIRPLQVDPENSGSINYIEYVNMMCST